MSLQTTNLLVLHNSGTGLLSCAELWVEMMRVVISSA